MTRVLLFVTDLKLGGTPTVVRELARRLPADDCVVDVACLGGFDETARQIADDGARVDAFDVGATKLPYAVRRLRDLVRARGIDVVFSFLVHANAVAALASRRLPDVRWWQSIQTTQPRPRWHWPVQRWAARRAEGVIVPSESVADVARGRVDVPAERVHVVPNALDVTALAATPRPMRREGDPLRVVFLGRLDPVKRVPMLVQAVRASDRTTLAIYGEGPERQRIEQAAAGDGRITLHGWATPVTALAEADVLVLPSEAEGFGLVLIEAMAAGVPVVGADVPGIRDVIRHGETGLLFDTSGIARPDLVATLTAVAEDPLAAQQRAATALDWVRRCRTWDAVIPDYRRLLLSTQP